VHYRVFTCVVQVLSRDAREYARPKPRRAWDALRLGHGRADLRLRHLQFRGHEHPGVLLLPISMEFGWSIGELFGPLGLRMALFGLVAPFAGALMPRYGPRAGSGVNRRRWCSAGFLPPTSLGPD
jgi:hypothetical protein